MSLDAMDALGAEREEVLAVANSLSPEEWELPSDCAGWRVQDVVAHMAAVFRLIVDPSSVPSGDTDDAEANAEFPVAERRGWSPDAVVAEYEEWSTKGIEALGNLQVGPMADTVIPLGNLGHHPFHLLADALVFDHYCHLRNDVLMPNGPIDREVPPKDELRLGPIMNWMMAGLPQMCADALTPIVTRPFRLRLGGPAGGEWVLMPSPGDDRLHVVGGSDADTDTVATSSTDEFVLWGTQRRPWRERGVVVEGDEHYAAMILDVINVI